MATSNHKYNTIHLYAMPAYLIIFFFSDEIHWWNKLVSGSIHFIKLHMLDFTGGL